MRRLVPAAFGILFLWGLLGCSQDDTGAQPATFDRAGDVAFACFDGDEAVFVARDLCLEAPEDDERYALVALVTQTGRGEIASVDLEASQVLDLDPGIPGFTFLRVAAVPTALVVPPDDPTFTYIASFGARSIQAVPTAAFHPEATGSDDEAHEVVLDGAPVDMVLGPEGDALYVAVPERLGCEPADGGLSDGGPAEDAGAGDGGSVDGSFPEDGGVDAGVPNGCGGVVYRLAIDGEGHLGAPEPVLDAASVRLAAPPALPASLPPSADVDAYTLQAFTGGTCAAHEVPEVPDAVPASDPTPFEGFHPVALEVDAERGHVLVADEGLPFIHRLDTGADATPAVLDPLAVRVPTRAIAVTPPVPSAVGDAPSARYLYAIDDTDRSVLVVDYTEGSSSFGAVLPVASGTQRIDRLPFAADARVIAVADPRYDPSVSDAQCTEDEALETGRLRGVYLMVGTADGQVRVVDVHDTHLQCIDCADGTTGESEGQWFLRRHAPRIADQLRDVLGITAAPLYRVDGSASRVETDGQAEDAPGLTPISCPADTIRIFPLEDDDEAQDEDLLCVRVDPWATEAQGWTAEWEGRIPGTSSSRGHLDEGTPVVEVPGGTGLCTQGVLGAMNVPGDPEDPLSAYAGDVLVVTSELPRSREDDPQCEPFLDAEERDEIAFRIAHARDASLELGAPVHPDRYDLELVRHCFPGNLAFEVRTSEVYTVSGAATGFPHPVDVADATDDTCVVSTDADPLARGRAFEGQLFRNGQVAFRIPPYGSGGDSPPSGTEVTLTFDVASVPGPLVLSVGTLSTGGRVATLLTALQFMGERLYVVDSANRGLLEVGMDPFRLVRTFE
ncbi:MAG: hypothetical protein ACOC97_00165 [Myxococcota bacterium]